MNLTKNFKYRILQLSETRYEVQFQRAFSTKWEGLSEYGTIESAKRCIKINKDKDKYPKVI